MHKNKCQYALVFVHSVQIGYNWVFTIGPFGYILCPSDAESTPSAAHSKLNMKGVSIMKVKLTKEAKRYITIAEMPDVRRIQEDLKIDGALNEYVEMAVYAIVKSPIVKLFNAEASIARNCRVNNYFTETSGMLDVWITAQVLVYGAFLDIGFYLTDVWSIGPEGSQEYFKQCAYVDKYVRQ